MQGMGMARLILAGVLFMIALLAVMRAPTYHLWKLAIGSTEWGHAFALICFVAAVPLWSRSWEGRLAVGLCVAAGVLALTPLMRALLIARHLPTQFEKAFPGGGQGPQSPLSVTRLFRGVSPPQINPRLLTFVTADGSSLSMDFYPSRTSSPSPLILSVHGGSWNGGDNKDFIPMDQFLAGRGFAVADILYRLAPGSPFPAASVDTVAAIRFLRQRAQELQIDIDRIVLLGRSAGGQIALQVAYTANDPAIRGVISFYAPADLYWGWDHPANPWVIDIKSVLTDYLGGGPSDFPANYAAASPVQLATSKSPPTLLFYGGRDELVSSYHGEALSRRLTELGVPNLNVTLPWATHGFDYILRGPGGQISAWAIESFLRQVSGRKA
jgi:acetyl esterase/lipase